MRLGCVLVVRGRRRCRFPFPVFINTADRITQRAVTTDAVSELLGQLAQQALLREIAEASGPELIVTGELDLDASMSTGTLRLHGSGSDSLGGDFASATFDVTGPVTRYNP